jgi:cytochrome c oxidase assembly protein subunit 15
VTSPRWRDAEKSSGGTVARIGAATVAMIFLQLLLGAVMRHTKAGLAIPDFPLAFGRVVPSIDSFPVAIHFAHRLGALAVAGFVLGCAVVAFRSRRPGLKRTALLLVLLVALQISLGAYTVLSRKAVPVTTAHVAAGALLLGTALAFTLASLRGKRVAEARAAQPGLARTEALA